MQNVSEERQKRHKCLNIDSLRKCLILDSCHLNNCQNINTLGLVLFELILMNIHNLFEWFKLEVLQNGTNVSTETS